MRQYRTDAKMAAKAARLSVKVDATRSRHSRSDT